MRVTDSETGARTRRLRDPPRRHDRRACGATPTLTGPDGPLGWRSGNVRASYVHGLLEHAAYRDALLGRAGIAPGRTPESLDARLSAIAAHVRAARRLAAHPRASPSAT